MRALDAASHEQIGGRAAGGYAAPGAARWLGLAAAPTFAIMAVWTGFLHGQPDMLCMAMQHSSPTSGMTLMYALMCVFHVAPWLRLITGRRSRGRLALRTDQANGADGMIAPGVALRR